MVEQSWGIQTTEGIVVVSSDSIDVRSSLSASLAGKVACWRHGDSQARARVAVSLLGVPLSLVGFVFSVSEAASPGSSSDLLLTVLSSGLVFAEAGRRQFADVSIPVSDVETVAVDETDRTLTIEYVEQTRSLSFSERDTTTEEYTLPTEADCREARDILKLRGFDPEQSP